MGKIRHAILLSLCIAGMQANGYGRKMETIDIQLLKGFPHEEEGIEKGVSACYAGTAGDWLLMAGGCNFPGVPAAEHGEKRYYRGIYAAAIGRTDTLAWHKIGDLPAEAAYGVSAVAGDTLYCLGGNNAQGSLRCALQITVSRGKAVVEPLPDLPCAIDNAAGCVAGRRLVVACGNWDGKPSCRAASLDLDNPAEGWQLLPDCPGNVRVQPVAASCGGALHLWAGFAPKNGEQPACLQTDGWRYGFDTAAWSALPPPADAAGETVFLGGGCAAALGDGSLVACGGVNKDIFLQALNHPQPGYMLHPAPWYRFNDKVFVYRNGAWAACAATFLAARAGAALAVHGGSVYQIGGELKPGIRFCGVVRYRFYQQPETKE